MLDFSNKNKSYSLSAIQYCHMHNLKMKLLINYHHSVSKDLKNKTNAY